MKFTLTQNLLQIEDVQLRKNLEDLSRRLSKKLTPEYIEGKRLAYEELKYGESTVRESGAVLKTV